MSSRGSKPHNGHELSPLWVRSYSGKWTFVQELKEFPTPNDEKMETAEGQLYSIGTATFLTPAAVGLWRSAYP